MAAFASCRRSGWVRFLVVLLCALFVFAMLGAPAARAEALTVGLFTAAAVLSAVTAALGFKLSNSAEGQATLAKMVQDFKVSATAVGLVLVGSKFNGLIDGVDYIKMQVKAGKTYLDEKVVAWVQQWLGHEGVYGSISGQDDVILLRWDDVVRLSSLGSASAPVNVSPISLDDFSAVVFPELSSFPIPSSYPHSGFMFYSNDVFSIAPSCQFYFDGREGSGEYKFYVKGPLYGRYYNSAKGWDYGHTDWLISGSDGAYVLVSSVTPSTVMYGNFSISNSSLGLSGTDTLGKDVIDLTLDQILQKLKEWAPDWWDAGADSSTNGAAAGAKDLPLNMGADVKTVTGNPALEVDQPLIYTPWFDQTLDNLRNGETAGTVTNTATSAADTADKTEAAEGTVEDAQGVVQSIISWGLDYISPDKGLFSRFPLCIPYDAYLLVTAALGVDAQDLGDIVGQSPGDLSAQVDDGVAVQSDFVPVLSVKHDWTQDGVTTPVEVTIDLRPYDAIIKMIRTLVSVYVIAELIASEYKRIRGS